MASERRAGVESPAKDSAPPSSSSLPAASASASARDGHHSHHAQREPSSIERSFVRPSDLLRPKPASKIDRPIDRDEREALKAIRDFLRLRNCYEVLPLSFRLIELDIGLTVKESLNILVQCGIVSAPLWDSTTSTYAGLLTVNDYLNVVRYYNLHTERLKDVDNLLLSDLKEVEHILQVKSPETISTSPEAVLYDALRKQLISRARRIPLVSYDSESQRTMVVSVITQYRILKFIAMNVPETEKLRKPLGVLRIGTYENVFRCSMEATVLDVIDEMVTRNISSVPVCTTDDVLLNVFEAVDVIDLLKDGDYSNLNWTVGRALARRNPTHPGVYTCTLEDGLDTIFDTIRKSRVHRLTVVDENNVLVGCISLSDVLQFLLVDGPEGKP